MTSRSRRAVRFRRKERARLRLSVLRLGSLLGWGPRDVIGFTEALTGQTWRQCGRLDLEAVRDEFLSLRWAIRRKADRRPVDSLTAVHTTTDYAHAGYR